MYFIACGQNPSLISTRTIDGSLLSRSNSELSAYLVVERAKNVLCTQGYPTG